MDFEVEDKTCRICGCVDTTNINIFDAKSNNLLNKILTVFPVIIYARDPLPKNICRKCVTNVSLMFEETSKLFKVQKKWIDNVRVNQPNHPYFQIMDLIESSHKTMIAEARTIEPFFPHREPRIFPAYALQKDDFKDMGNSSQMHNTNASQGMLNYGRGRILNDDGGSRKKETQKKLSDQSLPIPSKLKDVSLSVKKIPSSTERKPCSKASSPVITEEIKELQHKLQSNGCTLMSLLPPKLKSPAAPVMKFSEKCKYCNVSFPNLKSLAKHQLCHMVVTDRRIFDKKYLQKKFRRGRLIPRGDRKCIRCLNCWKLFTDNREVLDHWSNGDCEFYCQICGREFANNPKMLREHVPAAHKISFRSSRRREIELPISYYDTSSIENDSPAAVENIEPTQITIKEEPVNSDYDENKSSTHLNQAKKKQKNKSKGSTTRCSICGSVFANFRSKNSHMRKHKNRAASPQPTPLATIEIKQEKEESIENSMLDNLQTEIGEDSLEKPRLQVKKLSDLQDPSVSSQYPDDDQNVTRLSSNENPKQLNTNEDQMEYGKTYNCHPCGKSFPSKTELFEHKRQCQCNNKFPCGFCLRAFITSADLQMHIMLMH